MKHYAKSPLPPVGVGGWMSFRVTGSELDQRWWHLQILGPVNVNGECDHYFMCIKSEGQVLETFRRTDGQTLTDRDRRMDRVIRSDGQTNRQTDRSKTIYQRSFGPVCIFTGKQESKINTCSSLYLPQLLVANLSQLRCFISSSVIPLRWKNNVPGSRYNLCRVSSPVFEPVVFRLKVQHCTIRVIVTVTIVMCSAS